ncbi:unnamed protein product [Pieris brassicae]|uniref:Cuticle protein n=1 Tax=Pieris brassicae TaxID=7116 RepID=A0A9P0TBY3_PIEBR|nr:unnamed protein product [Pieris brassicae]
MLRLLCLCAFIVLSQGYAVPAAHTVSVPVAVPYVSHGYGGHGYAGHGYGWGHALGHGLPHYGHHIWKRSPYYVRTHGSLAPHIAPVAVSHQARVDVHSSPVVAVPVIKQIVVPFVPLHKPIGHYGGVYGHPHLGHY